MPDRLDAHGPHRNPSIGIGSLQPPFCRKFRLRHLSLRVVPAGTTEQRGAVPLAGIRGVISYPSKDSICTFFAPKRIAAAGLPNLTSNPGGWHHHVDLGAGEFELFGKGVRHAL